MKNKHQHQNAPQPTGLSPEVPSRNEKERQETERRIEVYTERQNHL